MHNAKISIIGVVLALVASRANWGGDKPMPCEAYRQLLRSQGKEDVPCPGSTATDTLPPTENCSCSGGLYICRHSLIGFRVSFFTHPDLPTFAARISNDIEGYSADKVHFLRIIGFADGTSDANGAGHWSEVPERCRKESDFDKFYDRDLARVRACMVHYELQKASKLTLELLKRDIKLPDLEEKDYPTHRDYEDAKYRKVEVTYTVEGKCQ